MARDSNRCEKRDKSAFSGSILLILETREDTGISREDDFAAEQPGQIAGLAALIQDLGRLFSSKISPAKTRIFQCFEYIFERQEGSGVAAYMASSSSESVSSRFVPLIGRKKPIESARSPEPDT